MLLLYPQGKTHISHGDDLEKERARLEAAINTLQVGFLLIDADHNLVTLNARAQAMLHVVPPLPEEYFYKDLPIINNNFTMQKLEEVFSDETNLKGMIDECILKKKPLEKREVSFGKKYFHLMLSPIVVFKQKPEVIGCVLLIEDATEARVLEKSRDEFFSIASHELRTPLTAIRGNISLIEQYYSSTVSDERFKHMLSDIHISSQRLIHIVDDFLDSSRLEQGRITFAKEVVKVDELVEVISKEYQSVAKEKGVTLSYDKPKTTVVAIGDPDRIKQIVINLVSNSLKHTEKGKVSLTVTSSEKSVTVRVSDTGMGIAEEDKKKLFTKFQKTENHTYAKDATNGSGLGLYISKLLAQGMEGNVTLEESTVGKGSSFVLTLPIAKE